MTSSEQDATREADCEHGYRAAGGIFSCPACDLDSAGEGADEFDGAGCCPEEDGYLRMLARRREAAPIHTTETEETT